MMGVAFSRVLFLSVVPPIRILVGVVFFSHVIFSVTVGVVSSHVIWCDMMGVAFSHVLFRGVVSDLAVPPTVVCYHVVFFSHVIFSDTVGVASSHVVWSRMVGVAFSHVLFRGVVSDLAVPPTIMCAALCYHVVLFSHVIFSIIVGVVLSHVMGVVRISRFACQKSSQRLFDGLRVLGGSAYIDMSMIYYGLKLER